MNDILKLGDKEFNSRFILGSGKFDPALIKACVDSAEVEMITLALRRVNESFNQNILDFIPKNITILPNTSGARDAKEAVRIANLSRELGCGNFIKLEVIRDAKFLFPDNHETLKATEILAKDGFFVMAYMHADLNYARDLQNVGAAAIMPLASPIGSNQGLAMKSMIEILVSEIKTPIIVDAGIGKPSQACKAMEMGCAAVMANTAIATAGDITLMAKAFKNAIKAGRDGYLAKFGSVSKFANASSPLTGFLRD